MTHTTLLVLLGAIGIGILLGVFAAIRRLPMHSDGPRLGPWPWDAAAVSAGIALGNYLRWTLARNPSGPSQTLAALAGLLIIGSLTFVRWPLSSPMRGFVLPLVALLIAAWGAAGR